MSLGRAPIGHDSRSRIEITGNQPAGGNAGSLPGRSHRCRRQA
jgi:hypothetical protein